jgi:hypothetical protein
VTGVGMTGVGCGDSGDNGGISGVRNGFGDWLPGLGTVSEPAVPVPGVDGRPDPRPGVDSGPDPGVLGLPDSEGIDGTGLPC